MGKVATTAAWEQPLWYHVKQTRGQPARRGYGPVWQRQWQSSAVENAPSSSKHSTKLFAGCRPPSICGGRPSTLVCVDGIRGHGTRCGPAAGYFYIVSGVSLEGSGPDGNMSTWDQGSRWQAGARGAVCVRIICWPSIWHLKDSYLYIYTSSSFGREI